MKRIFQVLALGIIALISVMSCSQSKSSPDWISISGNHFENEAGKTVVFKGVNIRPPHNLEEDGHWTMAHFQEAASWEDWKAINESLIKVVRANHPKSLIGVAGCLL